MSKLSFLDLQLKFECDQHHCSHAADTERSEATARTRNQRTIPTMRNLYQKLLHLHRLQRKRRVSLRARKVPRIRRTATAAMEATAVRTLLDLARQKAKVRTAAAQRPVAKPALMATIVLRTSTKLQCHKDRLRETMGQTVHLLHQMQ